MRRSFVLCSSVSLLALACADDRSSASASESGPTETGAPTESGTTETDTTETSTTETETETSTTEDPPAAICDVELSETISAEALTTHLLAFDAIATEHGGNRASGTSGYEASAAYVESQLQAAGYTTTRWPFTRGVYLPGDPPSLAVITDEPTVYTDGVDYLVSTGSPSGNIAAALEAVDLELGLGNQSTSGCEPEDFAGFTSGSVALLQRGTCSFTIKAQNAEDAGAVAVMIFNQGDTEEHMGLLGGSVDGELLTSPVLLTTYALGVALADAAALDVVNIEINVQAGMFEIESFNILAETDTGDPDHVILLGAHLDSVEAGPGVNDNGSGSAMVLELAQQFAACAPNNKVRFVWWGAEELGEIGSSAWVNALSDDELAQLAAYLNFDMVASPNFVRYVYSGTNGPPGSTLLHDAYLEWFDAHGLATIGHPFTSNSDYKPFIDAGVPTSGLITGPGIKTPEQAAVFGGTAEEPLDPCYHQACDDQQNFSLEVLGQNAQATAYVLQKLATDLGALATTPDIVAVPNVIAAEPILECGGHTHE